MTAEPEDQGEAEVSKGLRERARERLTLRYLIFVLPAVAYSVGVLVYYVVYGGPWSSCQPSSSSRSCR